MLPSTGYFKSINCPFYDNGLCERPYCHFRHVKKEFQTASSDEIESGAILQKLVSAAVQKVLQQTDTTAPTPEAISADDTADVNIGNALPKVTYNPTPISELNKINSVDLENKEDINEQRKRHIPVPYTPRKPASLPIKRPVETNGSSQPFVFIPPPVKYTPGCTDSVALDPYTPKGTTEAKSKYLPGSEISIPEYKPHDSNQQSVSKHNYVPSDKNVSRKKILEYKPTKVTAKSETSVVTYQPTPRSLAPCFSSDEEDEPTNKKIKLSSDLNELDLESEFDILDQILDEEKSGQDGEVKVKNIEQVNSNKSAKDHKQSNKISENKTHAERSHSKSDKSSKNNRKDKRDDSESNDKSKSRNKEENKNSSSRKNVSDSKNKGFRTEDKKDREKKCNEKGITSSKHSSHESSKSSRHRSSRVSEKDAKNSSSSKKYSKSKDKDHKSESHKNHKSSQNLKEKKKEKKKNKKSDNDYDISDVDKFDEYTNYVSESDEESRNEECKRIFEEYVPTEKSQVEEVISKAADIQDDDYIPGKKRISRTVDKNIKVTPRAPIKPDYKVSAAQAMAERLVKVKEYHASKTKAEVSNDITNKMDVLKSTHQTTSTSSSKIRIAHVPYASTLMNAKKTMSNSVKSEPSTSTTITQTVKKGMQRVAHMPNEKFIDRPGVLEPLGSRIAANIRSTYLNMMIDECLKLYLSPTDAYARAQYEELTTSKKCSTVQIYKNSAVLNVSRLRKEFQECNGVKKSGYDCSIIQKNTSPGYSTNAGSWSIEGKNRRTADTSQELSGPKLYQNLQKWILTEEQIQENGFPRPHPSRDKGRAVIYNQRKQNPPKGYIRTCCRCKKDYTVDKKGFAAVKQECIYHPNNKYRIRGEVRYQCCSQDGTSDGCCIAPSHVYEYVDYDNLKGYIKTLSPEKEMADYGVYSLDCEMCYTTHGLDLTRVTVINTECKVIYETLVRPLHPIIDYNTRYSGITEEQMAGVTTTLLEVQATLLAMFNSKSILIGHSLESDFKALKLIHDTIIDTSVLFPHKMGHPYKRALRNLSSEYLKKIIQNSVDGHDSAEDATVCMELIIFRLKEDLKTR